MLYIIVTRTHSLILRCVNYRLKEDKLYNLKKKSFLVYFSKFNRYVKEIGWNDSALINSLIKSLSPELKTSLIDIDLLGAFNACANVINKLYNDILYLTLKSIF